MRRALLIVALLTATSAVAEPYPEESRATFKQECTSAGGPKDICQCVLEQMESEIPFADLEAERFSQEQLLEITQGCVTRLHAARKTPLAEPGEKCETYATEVRAFCAGDALTPAQTSACPALLANVGAIEGGQLEGRDRDCAAAIKALNEARGLKPEVTTPTAVPDRPDLSWGEQCKAYFDEVPRFCADAAVPEVYKTRCAEWLTGLGNLKTIRTTPGVMQSQLDQLEGACKSGLDTVAKQRENAP